MAKLWLLSAGREGSLVALDWEARLQPATARLRSSAIRDLLAVTARPEVISFAGGLPAPERFPREALRAAYDAVLTEDGAGALQYGPTDGYLPLRAYLAERLARRGLRATPEEILITSGSQQALDLLGALFLGPASTALVEAPSYVGALQAFGRHEPCFRALPLDDDGLRVDHLAALLDGRPSDGGAPLAAPAALLYTVPTFQNPSGVTLTLERRRALLALAERRGLPLIEDDPYGELRYEGDAVPALRALPGGEDVIYLGSFSKILAPGLRLGWVVAPRPVIARLILAKQGADLHTDALAQRAVLRYCQSADLDAHISVLRGVYRERRDAMLAALAQHFPAEARWTRPAGGLFLWATLPASVDAQALLADALARGVAFVPGVAFAAYGEQHRCCLRLNFSNVAPDRIAEGVRRLAAALAPHLERAA